MTKTDATFSLLFVLSVIFEAFDRILSFDFINKESPELNNISTVSSYKLIFNSGNFGLLPKVEINDELTNIKEF